MEHSMATEEYRVNKPLVQLNPQVIANVTRTNNPPNTPVPQVWVAPTTSSSQHRKGSEIEQQNPPITFYALVNLLNVQQNPPNPASNPFGDLQSHLQDARCTVYFRYQSDIVTGNDQIRNFEPIYVY
jgi:hypothetical protein